MTDKVRTVPSDASPVVTSIKGFDANLRCRDQQYAFGRTYELSGEIKACSFGFHAIEGHPLEVFDYYPPAGSRYAEVQQSGELSRHSGDSKLASAKITIGVELSISDLVARAVKWVFDRAKPEGEAATGPQGAASATGPQGAASATGYQGAASATGPQGAASATGVRGAASATGPQGAASATGYQGAASATGDQGAASAAGYQGAASATGPQGAASATGPQGAASATGPQGAASATGPQGAASATGDQGAASATGDQGAASATGKKSTAVATGWGARAKAGDGCAIFLACRDNNDNILAVGATIIGQNGTKPDTWYRLSETGAFIEVESEP